MCIKHLLKKIYHKTVGFKPMAPIPLPLSEEETAQESYVFWTSNGFSPAQAVGLMANEQAETSFDWKAVGDHGEAYGIAQWHMDRVLVIKNGCGIDVRTAGHLDQLKAVLWELNHSEKNALSKLKVATTPEAAAQAICIYYERSGLSNQPSARAAKATVLAEQFIPVSLRKPKEKVKKVAAKPKAATRTSKNGKKGSGAKS